jgi:Domain of unknown function (DUF4159)
MHGRKILTGVLMIAVLGATSVYAQRFRSPVISQNQPPPTEFVAARLHFGTNGLIGHYGWSHNYPDSDQNLNEYIKRATRIDVEPGSYRIVELGSDEVFDYPFAYISEPGEMELTPQEAENLREFVGRGGFILLDDFDGAVQFNTMKSEIQQAVPDQIFAPIGLDHGIFSQHFVLSDLAGMSPYVPGGEITYYGLFDAKGRTSLAAGHNNDLANFWEWYAQGQMPLEPSTDAFRLGTNAVLYSMTH